MTRTVVAGIDSSTQSTKVLHVDAETGEILSKTSAPHPDGTSIDPEAWWEALQSQDRLADVAAISVSAQQHGMVALDAAGVPVHDALLWNDTRSSTQAKKLREALGAEAWAREIGIVPVPSFTVTKLAWLAENHPDLADRVHQVLLPHDWLTWRLAGRPEEATTDRSDASGTGYYSVPEGRYRKDILELAFGRSPLLPRVLAPSATAGKTASGALLAAGCGDNAGAALGLGLTPGEVVVSIGTSGTVFAPSAARIQDPSGAVAGFADATGNNLPLLATINAARTLAASARLLNVDLAAFDDLASAGAPDAGGLTLIPYLDGERTPDLPHATGTMTGLTRANLTAENLARASVLGLLCTLSDALDRLRAQGVACERVVLIGGGSLSRSVRRAAAEIFNAEVVIPAPAEYVALGAARQAAWALSGEAEPPTWSRSTEETHTPTGASWAAEVRGRFTASRIAAYGL